MRMETNCSRHFTDRIEDAPSSNTMITAKCLVYTTTAGFDGLNILDNTRLLVFRGQSHRRGPRVFRLTTWIDME